MNEMSIHEALNETYMRSPVAWKILNDYIKSKDKTENMVEVYRTMFEKALSKLDKDTRFELALENARRVEDVFFER